jgi:hypothetical protein
MATVPATPAISSLSDIENLLLYGNRRRRASGEIPAAPRLLPLDGGVPGR